MENSISFTNFQTGRGIEAAYTNPKEGRVKIDLYNDKGDIILHFNPRFDEREVVISSQIDGKWPYQRGEKPQRVDGYNFKGREDVTVTFIAKDDYIQILLDGKQFHDYKSGLRISSITTAKFDWSMGSGHGTPAVLKYLAVKFNLAE
ncbi:galectin-7-like [Dysidea avara]